MHERYFNRGWSIIYALYCTYVSVLLFFHRNTWIRIRWIWINLKFATLYFKLPWNVLTYVIHVDPGKYPGNGVSKSVKNFSVKEIMRDNWVYLSPHSVTVTLPPSPKFKLVRPKNIHWKIKLLCTHQFSPKGKALLGIKGQKQVSEFLHYTLAFHIPLMSFFIRFQFPSLSQLVTSHLDLY